ncbi:uncharacterized protein PHACADRAFT_247830 [Phanerochaete carnosa HHB-10118-sp]|uniref:Heparinase II/III-like C-terminal domain-containing protein n=1 Tax=Phanerochaete carnosa (strain HHB-10118-sp) TaxID=650164 RepID=K5WPE7_PHACS|nr:uncharacterized protein PHACADRAFT_247830 [Phanerochaete carnosa HHB-10118-sp]EKM61305.1 hypothetical protein PHACADRAFT_247830 [Phanerochaete carnosa HHB-10118-sp]
MAPSYHNANSPYGSGDPYYNESSGYITPMPAKKRTSNWIKFGIPVAICVIVAAVVGGVVGSRNHNSSSSSVSGAAGGSSSGDQAAASASSAASVKKAIGIFPTGTDSLYLLPLYPSTTNTAAFTTPTFSTDSALLWPDDPFQPSNPSPTNVRPDRPRLIAPTYKWQVLSQRIATDPYLSEWNDTIFGNATAWSNLEPVQYFMDGSSGILDNCRYVKERVKAWSYAYRMTNDTKWVNRTWTELQYVAGPDFGPNNSTKWNPSHFLDTAEMTAAFGIAYDWLYDVLTADQKSTILQNMLTYGLSQGVHAYQNVISGDFSGWWANNITGNWNCVCNNGMTMGALAILGDDTSGTAEQILGYSIPNALTGCALAITDDGSWTETANYWYFGTTGHAEMASSLMTAAGSDFGLFTVNPSINLTGFYHMHTSGFGSLFNYGDHGPNKYSSTANSMFLYGDHYQQPQYMLFQRDQHDAPDPWSMFWYDITASGAFWDGLSLDRFFDNQLDQWAAFRSSWTDENALYVAIKAGQLQNHQTHNDLDLGDFVIDALGTRWAGELGSGDYNSIGYFSSDDQESQRWLYYRKRTEGQNTILVNELNQNVNAEPKIVNSGSTGEAQGSSTVYQVPDQSTAFWVADLTSGYNDTTSFLRGIRTLNKRQQVLLQDDITTSQPIMWRMHTNATVTIAANGTTATLQIGDNTMQVQILSPSSGATFATMDPVRFPDDPPLPAGAVDSPNPGVTVLTISLSPGTYSLQVLFNPMWEGMSASDFVTPPSVPLDQWTLTSHN